MLQHSRRQKEQCGGGSFNYLIQSLQWHNTSSQQSPTYNSLISSPHNSYDKALSEANCSKNYKPALQPKSCPKPPVTQASGSGGLRGSCGKALQGRQVGSPNEPTACSPQPADHGAATAGHLMTMWKWPYRLWGQRDKQQGHTKITWAAKDANKLVFCTKKPSVFSSPCLCPEPYCWPWSI